MITGYISGYGSLSITSTDHEFVLHRHHEATTAFQINVTAMDCEQKSPEAMSGLPANQCRDNGLWMSDGDVEPVCA